MTDMVDNDASTTNETGIMSNTLYNITDNTPLFQDLINIQVPHYQNGGLPASFIPTRAGVNSMYTHHTPLNTWVSIANVMYGYSIPPWMEGLNWTQSYGSNRLHPYQPLLGRTTYLAQSGNTRIFNTEYSQSQKE